MAGPLNQRYLHAERYLQSVSAARSFATNRHYQLLFFHLPMPHKPGIGTLDGRVTYFGTSGAPAYAGNLKLADHALGEIRQTMQSNGAWNESWVIISTDHWWRKQTGNPGLVDHRIPFMVKAPKGRGGSYEKPFSTLITEQLVLSILRRELSSGDELASWLDHHCIPPPNHYATYSEPE